MKKGIMDGYKTYDTTNGYGNARKWQSTFSKRMTGEEAEEIIRESKETPYTILGITATATQAEIKAAYRKLIFQWHPDRNPGNETEANERSKKIIAAYTILKTN